MEFKKLSLEDRELFENYYRSHPQYTSYKSFANLFIWRNFEDIRYSIVEEHIVISGKLPDTIHPYFLLPQADKESLKTVTDALFRSYGTGFHLSCLTKEQKDWLEECYGDQFVFTYDRNADNYYYSTESLASLSGKKLHAKRNHINKFDSLYTWEYIPLDHQTAMECIDIAKDWCLQKNCEKDAMLQQEVKGCIEALMHLEELNLKGGAIRVDGTIVAFSIGERLNDETALIHIEKANTAYQGAYPVINNEFVKHEWADTRYINREEDMGLEGLRKAKLSYRPEFLLEMFHAEPKQETL